MAGGYFITGTDTGVGKTLVSCALLHAFAAKARKVVGMKPVVAGRENGRWRDVDMLMAASTVSAPCKLVNPYALDPLLSPHIAARQANIEIDLDVIHLARTELQKKADVVIVEGAGGFLVPISDRFDGADLARKLNFPVILVVGLRLGCLNHALLTAQAVSARGLYLAGWVANSIDSAMLARQENILTLKQRLNCPLLGVLPFMQPVDAKKCAKLLEMTALHYD